MAGRGRGRGRRKKLRSLGETNEEIDRVSRSEPVEQQIEYELPTDLMKMIISKLTLRDNIRASAVCKRWLNVAKSVRKANKPPLLMIFPKNGDLYEFCDPSQRKSYWLELPELNDAQVYYAKDGWLLLHNLSLKLLFFFSPYTRELVKVPYKGLSAASVAFSAAPTSRNCILAIIEGAGMTDIAVSTFRPRESTKWTTITYECGFRFCCCCWKKLVFTKGVFCCFSNFDLFGIYNPDTITWTVHPMRQPSDYGNFFMGEHDEDIFTIFTHKAENPTIYKLDLTNKVWSERGTLGGITLFVNALSSLGRSDLGRMRNKVYSSKVYYGKRFVSYSPDEGRYYPKLNKCFDWRQEALYRSVWMEPPENLSIFL